MVRWVKQGELDGELMEEKRGLNTFLCSGPWACVIAAQSTPIGIFWERKFNVTGKRSSVGPSGWAMPPNLIGSAWQSVSSSPPSPWQPSLISLSVFGTPRHFPSRLSTCKQSHTNGRASCQLGFEPTLGQDLDLPLNLHLWLNLKLRQRPLSISGIER